MRRRSTTSFLLAFLWMLAPAASAVVMLAPAVASAATWHVQQDRYPRGAVGVDLMGVSCPTRSWCMAVGSFDTLRNHGNALAERWNGTGWHILSLPLPGTVKPFAATELDGVSCTSPKSCLAVGGYINVNSRAHFVTMIERWDGHGWHVEQAPSKWGLLHAVSCPKPDACTAVGDSDDAEHWDGHRWTLQPVGAGSMLLSISCPAARSCLAAGGTAGKSGQDLVEAWDGKRWRRLPTPQAPSPHTYSLASISCRSPRACVAVGDNAGPDYSGRPVIEGWDGTGWTVEKTHGLGVGGLAGVSCSSLYSCSAVGGYAAQWDGVTWTRQTVPANVDYLQAVSCSTANACTAVADSGDFVGGFVVARYS